jgi:hypothetical protein
VFIPDIFQCYLWKALLIAVFDITKSMKMGEEPTVGSVGYEGGGQRDTSSRELIRQ